MWFKNAQVYRLTKALDLPADEIEALLQEFAFKPCGSQDLAKMGWVSPLGKRGQTMMHIADGQWLLCCKREEKLIPSEVINDELYEKVEAIEVEQGRPLRKKEKDSLKEEIIVSLLPRAFSRHQQTFMWVNTKDHWVVVDAASTRKAEDVLALLRKTIGSLPVIPFVNHIETNAAQIMTEWMKSKEMPLGFQIGAEAELSDEGGEGGVIKARNEDLHSDEIQQHLAAGKLVTSLALDWKDTLSFMLNDEGCIKRMKFSDELQSQNDDVVSEDELARFDADFTLMTGELSKFLAELTSALSGSLPSEEERQAYELEVKQKAAEAAESADPLFNPAMEYVKETNRASITAL